MRGSPSITFELHKEEDNSILCERLKKKAVETFRAQQWQGAGWSGVDMRVHGQGLQELVTVSPMPAIFLPAESQNWEGV
jgi:hypothetical protein